MAMILKSNLQLRIYEDDLAKRGVSLVAGVDEAGRGAWAGPIVVAAVILPLNFHSPLINDSKLLTKNQRLVAYELILKHCLDYVIEIVDLEQIACKNVKNATRLAMTNAISSLQLQPQHVLVDYEQIETLFPTTSIVKGDQKSISIAAASILAKVTRDNLMIQLSASFPNYCFEKHFGYGTSLHQITLKKYGPCAIHRRTFKPVIAAFAKARQKL